MADPAKTAKKRTALPPRIVQKTSRYPTAENQAQSTRKLLVRPSTMRQAKMTMTAIVMPLLGISLSVCSSCSLPADGVTPGASEGGKETPAARRLRTPAGTYPQPPQSAVILTEGCRIKKRRRDPHQRPADRHAIRGEVRPRGIWSESICLEKKGEVGWQ